MTRIGGRISGSAVLNDNGLRHQPIRFAGRLAGLLGPSLSRPELVRLLGAAGFDDIELDRSGGLTYFTAERVAT